MTKKVISSTVITMVVIFIISTLVLLIGVSRYDAKNNAHILENESSMLGQSALRYGAEYLENLDTGDRQAVWISADGKTLFDGSGSGEDYSAREEVALAMESGVGSKSYGVDSFSGMTISSAVRLEDGSVMLISAPTPPVPEILSQMAGTVAVCLILSLVIAAIGGNLLSRRLVAKINALDPSDPKQADLAADLEPLLSGKPRA